jgi:hypothetical protein
MLIAHTSALDKSLPDAWGVGHAELNATTTFDLVLCPLSAYSKAVTRQVEVFGWPPSAWRRCSAHSRAVLRRNFSPSEGHKERTKLESQAIE